MWYRLDEEVRILIAIIVMFGLIALVCRISDAVEDHIKRNSQCSSMRAHIQMQEMKLKAAHDRIENQQKTIEKLSTPLFTSMDKSSARKRATVIHEIRFQGK